MSSESSDSEPKVITRPKKKNYIDDYFKRQNSDDDFVPRVCFFLHVNAQKKVFFTDRQTILTKTKVGIENNQHKIKLEGNHLLTKKKSHF